MPPDNRRFLFLSLLVAFLACLPFLPGLPGSFIFDDIPNIVDNPGIHLSELSVEGLSRAAAASQLSGNTRLLPTLTFAFDYWRAGGADPATFKTTNIVIHAITAFALAWFFRSLLLVAGITDARLKWTSLALALAWAAHPLQVSSVLYSIQRLQTMGTLFLVLALIAYLHARRAQIAGSSGRSGLLLTVLLWAMAIGCKEDSALLPAYTLALELTVLRFAAADTALSRRFQRFYLIAALAGTAVYLLVVVPGHWHQAAYAGRDFNTLERLLTQGRVLVMYLWQIVAPAPQHMPFYYDWLQPSRGLLIPWTTLPSLLLVVGLLLMAWRIRHRHALFSLGVFLFFSAHFVTSNVVGLELAFEHRNNFALIGAVLAIGSLLAQASRRLQLPPRAQGVLCILLLTALASTTMLRAHAWSDGMTFARLSAQLAPHSARAWAFLCQGELEQGGGAIPGNPNLDNAADACAKGTDLAPYALNNPALLIVLKTLRGDVLPRDWDLFQHRLETDNLSIDDRRTPFLLISYSRKGVALDKQRLLLAIATLVKRTRLDAFDLSALGYFIMDDLNEPEMAIPYFEKAIEAIPTNNPFPKQLEAELRAKGYPELAKRIERNGMVKRRAVSAPDAGKQ
ncbi:hypothetical protein [Thermomonas sp. HDW16]|uniref:hypothetical protein n=1 Tax=Thermomonas sp. HDW16 TaxID=2714945 RepID=UPI001408DD26|nr:hypothetical protein [Thermomonas sp. HDW16]QIL21417.1 hypothetical protein G7079_12105 [Thermomonas sp. HDW16]